MRFKKKKKETTLTLTGTGGGDIGTAATALIGTPCAAGYSGMLAVLAVL
jgi:hypothetical protein